MSNDSKASKNNLSNDVKTIKSSLRSINVSSGANEEAIKAPKFEKRNCSLGLYKKGFSELDMKNMTSSSVHSQSVCLPSTSSAVNSLIFYPSTTVSISSSLINSNSRRQSSGILEEALNRPQIISVDSDENFNEKQALEETSPRFALSLPNTTSINESFEMIAQQVSANNMKKTNSQVTKIFFFRLICKSSKLLKKHNCSLNLENLIDVYAS